MLSRAHVSLMRPRPCSRARCFTNSNSARPRPLPRAPLDEIELAEVKEAVVGSDADETEVLPRLRVIDEVVLIALIGDGGGERLERQGVIYQIIDLRRLVKCREILPEDALCENRKFGNAFRILDPDEIQLRHGVLPSLWEWTRLACVSFQMKRYPNKGPLHKKLKKRR